MAGEVKGSAQNDSGYPACTDEAEPLTEAEPRPGRKSGDDGSQGHGVVSEGLNQT